MAASNHLKASRLCIPLFAAVMAIGGVDVLLAEEEGVGVSNASPADKAPLSASGRVLVGYKMAPNSPPAAGAELWYTQDRGKTWQRGDGGKTTENPIAFDAPQDGLYGFYIVLYAEAGGSGSSRPQPGSAPQQWARVDRSAPAVQILALAPDERFDLNREIHIRWAVKDDNLPNRPVSLSYRDDQAKSFQLIADSLAANSSYRWTVPADAIGRLEIRVVATDQAGNTGRYIANWLRIDGTVVLDTRRRGPGGEAAGSARPQANPVPPSKEGISKRSVGSPNEAAESSSPSLSDPEASQKPIPEGAASEAQKRYDLGTWHRLRGEQDEAKVQFGEALKLNPELLAARNDLAGVLYLQGDYEGAERELAVVLAKDQRHRAALKTLALVQATRRNYHSSAESLQKLLLLDAEDAEAWLYLGDVRLFMGERAGAREAWSKASSIGSASEETQRRAEKRLSIYRSDGLAAAPERQ